MKKILLSVLLLCSTAYADITQQMFSFNQVFDVQWYISNNILRASGFNYIYASQPTNARLTAAQTNAYTAAGDVIRFFNSSTNPGTYGLGVYDPTGTTLIRTLNNTGTFTALANGAIFYNGAGMWGTLFTTSKGYSIGGADSFAVTTLNPTTTQLQSYTPPTTQPLSSGQTAQTKTVVSTSTTNQTSTTVTYGQTTTSVTYQTRTVYTTNSAGNQIVQTYSDTVTTTSTPKYTTTTTTPVTTTTYSDGSTSTSNGTPTTSTVTEYITSSSISYATTPTSTAPWICCGGGSAPFNASTTYIAQVQTFVSRPTSDSQVYIDQVGDSNTITVNQTGTKNNYAYISNNGSNNNISVAQSGNSNNQTNYSRSVISGNNNNINITQNSTGGAKGTFTTVQNNNNNVTLTQTESGSHYAEVGLSGGNKTVNINQSGSASQMASVQLSGNPTSLTLQQSGATQNFYSIQFNCATAGGCAPINVKQGN